MRRIARREETISGASTRISASGHLRPLCFPGFPACPAGRDAIFAYFGGLGQETGGTFRAELQHLLADDDDRVVGIQRSTAERGGKHLDVGNCIVFKLKDGRVTDGREHFHDLYAWDEFWS